MHGSRGSLIAVVAAVLLGVGGVVLIGITIASQHQAPPTPAMGGFGTSLAEIVEASNVLYATAEGPEVIGPILPRSKPVALDIPSIGVHSSLQHLGQTDTGALETPAPGPRYDEAAWYRYSPTPGALGPAVLLGHVDSAAGGPSVFFRLGELRRGDRVSVTRADDSIATFVVDEVQRYAKDNFPTRLVYGDINHAGLRIVTCGGAFDDTTGHYVDNIVVFASLVDPKG